MVLMEAALTLSLAAVLWKYNKFIPLFLVMSFVSMFYPHYGPMSFYAQKMVFLGCLWFFFIVHFVNDIELLLNAMCYGALLNLIVQCLQVVFMPLEIPFWLGCEAPVGLMANPNETSALYVFCLPAFFRDKWKMGIPLMLFGLYFSHSTMGWICLIIGFLMWLHICRHNFSRLFYFPVFIGICLGIAYYLLCVPIETLNLRIVAWKYSFLKLKQHWIMGAGIGHWKVMFGINAIPETRARWVTAHNDIYQLWAEMGIIPIMLLTGYFISLRQRIMVIMPGMTMVIIAIAMITVNSIGNFPWHIAPLAMIALTWIAILEIELRKIETTQTTYIGDCGW